MVLPFSIPMSLVFSSQILTLKRPICSFSSPIRTSIPFSNIFISGGWLLRQEFTLKFKWDWGWHNIYVRQFQGSITSAGNEDTCPGAVQRECVSCSHNVDHCVSVNTPDDGWYRRGSRIWLAGIWEIKWWNFKQRWWRTEHEEAAAPTGESSFMSQIEIRKLTRLVNKAFCWWLIVSLTSQARMPQKYHSFHLFRSEDLLLFWLYMIVNWIVR